VRGVEDATCGLRAAHALEGLRGEDNGRAVAADDLDHSRRAFAVGDRGELVDDGQDLTAVGVAGGEVLLEVLDEEAADLAGLFGVEQLVEEEVAAVGVLEGPGPVELASVASKNER
jgi:hypothetical protein